jgi:hypothetical protein
MQSASFDESCDLLNHAICIIQCCHRRSLPLAPHYAHSRTRGTLAMLAHMHTEHTDTERNTDTGTGTGTDTDTDIASDTDADTRHACLVFVFYRARAYLQRLGCSRVACSNGSQRGGLRQE